MGKAMIYLIVLFIVGWGLLYYLNQQTGVLEDSADMFTGESAVDALQRVKAQATKADLHTYRTAVTMYYINENKFPESLQDLFDANLLSSDAMKDPWGQPFRSEVRDKKLIIYSSGKSKIAHTSDDIWAEIPLQ